MNCPFISIVMPTRQRRGALRVTLEALARVEYPPERMELVLVCDGCTDGSAEMARSLRLPFEVSVLEQRHQGPAAARNLALGHARGPLVLFLDDDVLPSAGLLAAHAKAHLDGPCQDRVVIGALLPPGRKRSPWVRWELDTVARQYTAMEAGDYRPGPRQFYTGNASVALDQVTAAGGFDVAFQRAEDVELAFRLQGRGLRFVFRRDASALHLAERSFRSWFVGAYQYGRNDVVLGLRRGRPDMLGAVAGEFWDRNQLVRGLVHLSLRAPGAARLLVWPAVAAAWLAQTVGWRVAAHSISSAVFTSAYWRGLSDELGGAAAVRHLIQLGTRSGEVDWAAFPQRLRPSSERPSGLSTE